MKLVFELADAGRQTEQGFDQHPFAPGFVGTELEVTRCLACFLETKVTQHNRFLIELMGNGAKSLVMNIGSIPVPGNHFAAGVDQPAQLNAHDPAAIAVAFLTHLLFAPSFTDRMNQFNAIGVDDGEEGRVCQQTFTPILVRSARVECGCGQPVRQTGVQSRV